MPREYRPDEIIIDIPSDVADWNIPEQDADGRWVYADTRPTPEIAEAPEPPITVHTLPADATPDEISSFVRAIRGQEPHDD